ncbi:hypothetical protein ACRZ5O_22750 [Pseudomonas protegens]|uniref:hypothetical protein n=1 Tax=Pseudomonas protegens TaxID=380021 RepID=UPI003FD8E86F
MSNEMISVPRELLRWMHDFINDGLALSKEEASVSEQLRALLAKPAKPTKSECPHCLGDSMFGCAECEPEDLGQHQGEPVAVMYADGSVLTKAECGSAFDICCKVETPLYTRPAEQPATVAVASREESISWLKRIDGIGQNRADLIYSMGFRRHTEVPQS